MLEYKREPLEEDEIEKIITADSKQLAAKGAEIVCKTAKETVDQQGRFAVAVSGGSTPRAMHRLMSQEPYLSDIPWQKTHVFMVYSFRKWCFSSFQQTRVITWMNLKTYWKSS